MKFFLPMEADAAKAEILLESMARHLGAQLPKKRIYRVAYQHNGINCEAVVGLPAPAHCDTGKTPVEAIIGVDPLVMCFGNPYSGRLNYIGLDSVHSITYFDFDSDHQQGAF